MKTRRLVTLLTVLIAGTALSACGNRVDEVHEAETEGIYVDVGDLQYQVQISRQLNPTNIEDKSYLVGLGPFDRTLGPENVWFAVFIRAENDRKEAIPSAKTFELHDTQENVFTPIALRGSNVFAYRPAVVPAKTHANGTNPLPDSAAFEGPTQGAMLLFKVPRVTLDNRPLELVITPPKGGEKGIVVLDV